LKSTTFQAILALIFANPCFRGSLPAPFFSHPNILYNGSNPLHTVKQVVLPSEGGG